jgi:hypothetical protein
MAALYTPALRRAQRRSYLQDRQAAPKVPSAYDAMFVIALHPRLGF